MYKNNSMKKYPFYYESDKLVKPISNSFNKVKNQFILYEMLLNCWTKETCAPRLRDFYSESNKTVGQCSITSILVQDIFGGEIYGVVLPDGSIHCFNIINGVLFDLTSEQFHGEKLEYNKLLLQDRDEHLLNSDKKDRYNQLKNNLLKLLDF